MSDAITLSRNLVAAGFTQKQAEVVAVAVTRTDQSLATKADLAQLKAELKAEFKAEIAELKAAVKIGLALIIGQYLAIATLYISGL